MLFKMNTRRSKRLSKSSVLAENEDSGIENKGKKQKLDKLEKTSKDEKKAHKLPPSNELHENGVGNLTKSPSVEGNESDSSNSSVDYMKSPHTLDLDSDFFKIDLRKKGSSDFQADENKVVSQEQQLTDSSSDEDSKTLQEHLPIPAIFTQLALAKMDKTNNINETKQKINKKKIKTKLNSSHDIEPSTRKKNKKRSMNIKTENPCVDNLNVSELLALGETQIVNEVKKIEPQSEISDGEMTDWEEVRGEEHKEIKHEVHSFPKEGVQITVESPDLYHKRKKKGFDMAAFVKRKMNQVKREQQILIHKVHLLCWVAHGLYINSVINSQVLMGLSLSLIPSQHCYPNRVDLIYLKKISGWFIKTVPVIDITLEKAPFVPLLESLQQQFGSVTARSHRDLVLMFVCLLRSLGLTVRLIISLQPLPLKPSSNELCEIETKKGRPKKKEKKKEQKLNKKVLSPDEARKSNKKVLSKDEAIKRLKSAETDGKIKTPKTKKPRVESPISRKKEDNEKPRRSFRPRKSLENKYKDDSSSSDEEIIPNKIAVSSVTEKSNSKMERKVENKMKGRSSEEKNSPSCSSLKVELPKRKSSANTVSKQEKNERNDGEAQKNSENFSPLKDENASRISRAKVNQDSSQVKKLSGSPEAKNDSNKNRRKNDVPIHKSLKTNASPQKGNCDKRNDSRKVLVDRTKSTLLLSKNNQGSCSSLTSEDEFLPQSQIRPKTSEKGESKKKKQNLKKHSVKKQTSTSKTESESDFEHELTSKMKQAKAKSSAKSDIDRRVLSSESDYEIGDNERKYKNDYWVEVFVDSEKWVPIDVISAEVDCVGKLYKRATKPVAYIVAWNPDLTLKDVTRRYCAQFHSVTRKQRVEENWWREALFPFLTSNTALDKKEDEEMHKQIQELPLPLSIAEYKNHPLYALKRHLLKFQAIYPADAPTLGFVKGEPVYARECVHTLHSREIWLKEAKTVKLGEQPYKIVKARPKWDRMSGKVITDMPLEIFGPWQVEDYVPPTATDGKVPRNAYGNVELFKPSMLPKGTVHLQVPGLNRVAKKLQIDCAPAVVGFDYHCGACHPMYDGFVVCEEFQDVLLDAWNRDQEEAERRDQEKRDKRVYGNWRRLIKGLLIRERLKVKYAFGEPVASTSKSKKGKKCKSASKKIIGEEEDSE